MILRLTESDLRKLIFSSVNKILKEEIGNENTDILSTIVSRMVEMQDTLDFTRLEGELDIPLDDEGVYVAFVSYSVDDSRYKIAGQVSMDRDIPNDPDEVDGDFNINVNEIAIYEDGEHIKSIHDNGMVADAIKSLAEPSEENLEYYNNEPEYDFDSYEY